MTPIDPNPRTRHSLPTLYDVDAPTRAAIVAYIGYRDDPVFAPKPGPAEVRLVAQYCHRYIEAAIFRFPREELAVLRADILHISSVTDLADWLWECRRIGIEPL